jgi:L,D-transpeptidase YcbB
MAAGETGRIHALGNMDRAMIRRFGVNSASRRFKLAGAAVLMAVPLASVAAQQPVAPQPRAPQPSQVAPQPRAPQPLSPALATPPVVEAQPVVLPPVAPAWQLSDAQALLAVIQGIEAEGLIPADYKPDELRAAIAAGMGVALNEAATRSFTWLAEDLRDGRTPMESRKQWFVVDPDADLMPASALLSKALEYHDVAGVLDGLAPLHPDYQALKAALAATPKTDTKARALLRVNLDRWRWLARDLGKQYLITNVPEYQLRLTVNDKIVRTYRTVVGSPRTPTPQLAEIVEGVVFNPTWTVPQSIVVGEGLGAQLLRSPKRDYKVTKGADGFISVVQQPGPNNALGLVKLDMPNRHAIFLHDTPSRHLFATENRALSHGCVRTERALELGITLAILMAGKTPEESAAISTSGTYTKVPMTKHLPIYITYFTMGRDINGKLSTYKDIYGRDVPVLASFAAPRQLKTGQRVNTQPIIPLENGGI